MSFQNNKSDHIKTIRTNALQWEQLQGTADGKILIDKFLLCNYLLYDVHTPMPLMANVVYQFTCLRDANSTYIGKTVRHLATRVTEHTTSSSVIKEHLSSYSC